MTPFKCSHCTQTVFFENSECGACSSLLGYLPGERNMVAFELPSADQAGEGDENLPADAWLRRGGNGAWLRPCANRINHNVCNWMLDVGDEHALCISCRLTDVIPSLDDATNLQHWGLIERAKRRLVFTLMDIGLTPQPKTGPDDKQGLSFHLLENQPGMSVMTGHDDGLITLNIAEADDVFRESARVSMHEPVRTLLGHLRHEVSHYLQQRYITGTPGEQDCKQLFGDHDADYAAALQAHYSNGPPADWPTRFISAYASSHPWEDWAETCAHYLLVIDAVQTASSWGLQLDGPAKTQVDEQEPQSMPLENLVIEHWLPVAQFLNAMNRSLGLPDSYPFLLPPQVLEKMKLVQDLLAKAVEQARESERSAAASASGGAPADDSSNQVSTDMTPAAA